MKRRVFSLLIILMLVFIVGCQEKEVVSKEPQSSIILATTTSTRDSGLLDYILPKFLEEANIEVKVVAVGTGKALQMGRDGEADVLLVHAKPDEEVFVQEGHGTERHDVMYNDFIMVGPDSDLVKGTDIVEGLKTIKENKLTFSSRGDDSGTHKKELSLWKEAGIDPKGDWYISTGSGMGDTLKVADEKQGYALTDRATYLNLKDTLSLDIVIEKDERLFNQYGVIPVKPEKNSKIKHEEAKIFMDWLLSKETQELIGKYGVEEYGMPLFFPNGK